MQARRARTSSAGAIRSTRSGCCSASGRSTSSTAPSSICCWCRSARICSCPIGSSACSPAPRSAFSTRWRRFRSRGSPIAIRAAIIALALAFWSAMTLLQSWATGFLTLALTRAGVAIGEAGSGPASMSMMTDLFPPDRRTRAFAILAAQAPFGAAIGALAAGLAREAIGWRGALMFVGVPGLIYAADRLAYAARTHARLFRRAGRAVRGPAPNAAIPAGLPAFRHTLIAYTILVMVAGAQSFDRGVSRTRVRIRADGNRLVVLRGGSAVDGRLLLRGLVVRPADDARCGLGAAPAGDLPDCSTSLAFVYYQAPNSTVVVALALTGAVAAGRVADRARHRAEPVARDHARAGRRHSAHGVHAGRHRLRRTAGRRALRRDSHRRTATRQFAGRCCRLW